MLGQAPACQAKNFELLTAHAGSLQLHFPLLRARACSEPCHGCQIQLAMANRKPYPTDVSDEEWAFVAPYLILFPLDAGQRRHDLREIFNAPRYVVRTGCP